MGVRLFWIGRGVCVYIFLYARAVAFEVFEVNIDLLGVYNHGLESRINLDRAKSCGAQSTCRRSGFLLVAM